MEAKNETYIEFTRHTQVERVRGNAKSPIEFLISRQKYSDRTEDIEFRLHPANSLCVLTDSASVNNYQNAKTCVFAYDIVKHLRSSSMEIWDTVPLFEADSDRNLTIVHVVEKLDRFLNQDNIEDEFTCIPQQNGIAWVVRAFLIDDYDLIKGQKEWKKKQMYEITLFSSPTDPGYSFELSKRKTILLRNALVEAISEVLAHSV
jgi:hypothetical protein